MTGSKNQVHPGDVSVSRGRKTVYLTLGVWLAKDGMIHISFGKAGIITVSNNPRSKQYHKQLYAQARGALQRAERWNPVEDARHLDENAQITMAL
ncbi:MAG: hypothetical protein HPY50_17345 [Firmicutes bacterium]|nr:hypothetical protein [Bacillota bacterium]